jgi:Sulfatase-modifying factor enzyme 1
MLSLVMFRARHDTWGIVRNIALPASYIWVIGATLMIVGAVIPAWRAYSTTRSYATHTNRKIVLIGDGPIRSPMVVLPPMPNGARFAITDHIVTNGQFLRAISFVSEDAPDRFEEVWNSCGVPWSSDRIEDPISCVSESDARKYANAVTAIENKVRQLSFIDETLTPCYNGSSADTNCTGYRLPTAEELVYALEANKSTALDENGCPMITTWPIVDQCKMPELTSSPGNIIFLHSGSTATPGIASKSAGFRLARTINSRP